MDDNLHDNIAHTISKWFTRIAWIVILLGLIAYLILRNHH